MEGIKRAHYKRAKSIYDDENTETPGSFEEFFQGQYIDEYGKQKRSKNAAVNEKYMKMLAAARGGDVEEKPGLLARIQKTDKGPYPANAEEDDDLLDRMWGFLYSDQLIESLLKTLKTSKNNVAQTISQLAANIAGRLLFESRKHRAVSDETGDTVVRIVVQELWVMARNMGLKEITQSMVDNSIEVALSMFEQFKKQGQTPQAPQPQQGGLL